MPLEYLKTHILLWTLNRLARRAEAGKSRNDLVTRLVMWFCRPESGREIDPKRKE
jgi:hypothetical protein